MDAQQLWETTLDPKTRILKQVEIEDARMASSGDREMLMGTDTILVDGRLSTRMPERQSWIFSRKRTVTIRNEEDT